MNNSIILPSIQGGQANQVICIKLKKDDFIYNNKLLNKINSTLSSVHDNRNEGYIDMMIHKGPLSIDHKVKYKIKKFIVKIL